MSARNFRRLSRLATVALLMSLVAAFVAVPATQASDYVPEWHTVQRGENLFRIALRYGTTVAYLQSLNHIPDANRIYAGQTLRIRPASPGGTAYVVQKGDTLFRIARRYGVNMWVLAKHNNIQNVNRIYAGQTLLIPDVTIQ